MNFTLPDPSTTFGARVAERLRTEQIIWIVTVAADGTPQPNPVWFYWDGSEFLIYSLPNAARVSHIRRDPHVSLLFNSSPGGNDVVVFNGVARLVSDAPSPDQVPAYVERYSDALRDDFENAEQFAKQYSLAIHVTPTKVRGF